AYRYRIPASLADRALPGARVVVPVRQGEMVGIVMGFDRAPESGALRDILGAPLEAPALTPGLLELAGRAARHWGAPPGMMLRAMLPAALWGRSSVRLRLLDEHPAAIGGTAGALVDWLVRRGGAGSSAAASRALRRPVWEVADRLQRIGVLEIDTIPAQAGTGAATERVASLAGEPLTLVERENRFGRSPAQARLYAILESSGGSLSVPALLKRAAASDSSLRAMVRSDLVRIEAAERMRDPFADLDATPPPPRLTDDQRAALRSISALPDGSSALLFGVTGSGKTAIYLERISQLLRAGRGAILLVPEIALTPQTVARVRGAFGDQVAVLHSALSDGERADAWRALRRGERMVAVGARSAVFAPIAKLGVIVLDEEHESSYKNGETPRYHA
ncbi:MAG TPA: DEAD/DEAH box helicase, partial [Gemmatimonadales bacterium]|nr:DEAD/DEAH box helicase [Gemmatimonadales bacterium]